MAKKHTSGPEQRESLHRYAPIAKAMDYIRLGWMPQPTLSDTLHGDYSVHVSALPICACGRTIRAPQSESKRFTPNQTDSV